MDESTWDGEVDAVYIDFRGDNDEPALKQVFAYTDPGGRYEVVLDIAPSGKFLGAADALDARFLQTLERNDDPTPDEQG